MEISPPAPCILGTNWSLNILAALGCHVKTHVVFFSDIRHTGSICWQGSRRYHTAPVNSWQNGCKNKWRTVSNGSLVLFFFFPEWLFCSNGHGAPRSQGVSGWTIIKTFSHWAQAQNKLRKLIDYSFVILFTFSLGRKGWFQWNFFFFSSGKEVKIYFALLFISAAASHSRLPPVGHTSRCFMCPFPHPEAAPKLQRNPVETLQSYLPFSLWHTINSKGLWGSMRDWSLNGNQTFNTETCCEEKQDSTLEQCTATEFGKRSTIAGSTHFSTRTDKSFVTVLLQVLSFERNLWLNKNFSGHLTAMDH